MTPRKKVDAAALIERKTQALDFRKAGYTYRQIGERLGITHVQAFRDVQDGLKELVAQNLDSAAELRQIELERLDKAIKGLMPFVEAGSANHAAALVRVIEQRAKLLGLYEPVQIEETVTYELSDSERSSRVIAILERARQERDRRATHADDNIH